MFTRVGAPSETVAAFPSNISRIDYPDPTDKVFDKFDLTGF
jgi:hypothetical protein